jgi:uncharacterized damage-inducible protein DinB
MKTEGIILAETMHDARRLAIFYYKQLENVDIYKRFPIGESGQFFNSVHWVMAHLAVTENFLLLHTIGGEKIPISWARSFGLGSTGDSPNDSPSIEEILDVQRAVHKKSLEYVKSLSNEDMDQPTINGITFGTDDTRRSIIRHAIRHEGLHTGHLSWLCRLHGLKII